MKTVAFENSSLFGIVLYIYIGHHYGSSGGCGYDNFSVTIIEQVRIKTMDFLAERETFWQHQLRVYVENGGNGHCFRKDI